jgi:hypothetical protein
MLSWAALECNFPAIDSHGPNQIPVFHNPQGGKAGLTKVLAQFPVTSGKNKGALYDATGGALGGRQGGFVTAILAVSDASQYIAPRKKKLEIGNWKLETGSWKLAESPLSVSLLETRRVIAYMQHRR